MPADGVAVLTILGMAAVTYATRAGGLWLMGRLPLSPRVEAWLRYVPGAVLVALVAPGVVTAGPADALAALITALVTARTRNFLLAVVAGVAAAVVLRRVFA